MRHLVAADSFIRRILKARQGATRKIGTKDNVSDVLSKHVNKKVLDELLPKTGWGPVEQSYRTVGLNKVNDVKDLKSAEHLEKAGRAKVVADTCAAAKTLAAAALASNFVGANAVVTGTSDPAQQFLFDESTSQKLWINRCAV